MLRKKYVSWNELDSVDVNSEYGIIISISEESHLSIVASFFERLKNRIRGILIPANILAELELNCKELHINYVGITFSGNTEMMDLSVLNSIKSKPDHFFLEGRFSYKSFKDNFDYTILNSFDKIIIDCTGHNSFENINSIISECVVLRKFPFFMGLPFCVGPLPMHFELHARETNELSVPDSCSNCALKEWCCYNGGDVAVKPFEESSVRDVLDYLADEKNTIDRI